MSYWPVIKQAVLPAYISLIFPRNEDWFPGLFLGSSLPRHPTGQEYSATHVSRATEQVNLLAQHSSSYLPLAIGQPPMSSPEVFLIVLMSENELKTKGYDLHGRQNYNQGLSWGCCAIPTLNFHM